MRNLEKGKHALEKANLEIGGETVRSLWLAKAADYAITDRASLVGGAAVNLHTGSYNPTDVDLCARLDESDREALVQIGFRHFQGDHFSYLFDDGQEWLLEFPDSQVDGDVMTIRLSPDDLLSVIRPESLIVDRVLQATDRTRITYDEALRLCLALFDKADWQVVSDDIRTRDSLEPGLKLQSVYDRLIGDARSRWKDPDSA